jgi:hypothetical protein
VAGTKYLDIVFDSPGPGSESTFVEIEDDTGKSVSFGKWVKRDDGYYAIRFTRDDANKVLD